MKLVESAGHVWQFTNACYQQMLWLIAQGREVDCMAMGKFVGVIDCPDIYTITAEDAAKLLKELDS